MKQHEAVISTLERLGGAATLGTLYQEVFKIKNCEWKTKTPFASIRRIVQENSEIYKVKPGLWALEKYRKRLEADGIMEETAYNSNSQAIATFNHTYYQALLVQIGNMKQLRTYVPSQDKNKLFLNKTPLTDLCTLNEIPRYSYEKLVHRSDTIDVIWFKPHAIDPANVLMPHAFFEVEHSTDFQNSLLKYGDLTDFNSRMVIVADQKRKVEFENKMSFSSLTDLKEKKRVEFLSYDKLVETYELIMKQHRQSLFI